MDPFEKQISNQLRMVSRLTQMRKSMDDCGDALEELHTRGVLDGWSAILGIVQTLFKEPYITQDAILSIYLYT